MLDYDLGDDDYQESITRAKFESLCEDLFKECTTTMDQVLADAKLSAHQIDEIVLVGGSSKIPKVREIVKQFFGGKELNQTVNPDEAVANGATIQAAILAGEIEEECDIVLMDVTPLSLGTHLQGGLMDVVIARNSQIPIAKETEYTTVANN